MMGLLKTKHNVFIFRDDVQHDHKFYAWDIYDDYDFGITHKWNKLPKGHIERFNLENPPRTVRFIPIII